MSFSVFPGKILMKNKYKACSTKQSFQDKEKINFFRYLNKCSNISRKNLRTFVSEIFEHLFK